MGTKNEASGNAINMLWRLCYASTPMQDGVELSMRTTGWFSIPCSTQAIISQEDGSATYKYAEFTKGRTYAIKYPWTKPWNDAFGGDQDRVRRLLRSWTRDLTRLTDFRGRACFGWLNRRNN